jgi:uncharacterized protein YqeY
LAYVSRQASASLAVALAKARPHGDQRKMAMTLMKRIGDDIAAAMRAKDPGRLAPLRMAKAALMNKEVEKGGPLDDAESQQVIASLIKQRKDSVEQFAKGGRRDLVEKESAEIATLEAYLPPPVDPAEIEAAVDAAIAETSAASLKDLGRVMKAVMPKLAGRTVDGKTVNELVRRKLGA